MGRRRLRRRCAGRRQLARRRIRGSHGRAWRNPARRHLANRLRPSRRCARRGRRATDGRRWRWRPGGSSAGSSRARQWRHVLRRHGDRHRVFVGRLGGCDTAVVALPFGATVSSHGRLSFLCPFPVLHSLTDGVDFGSGAPARRSPFPIEARSRLPCRWRGEKPRVVGARDRCQRSGKRLLRRILAPGGASNHGPAAAAGSGANLCSIAP